MRVFYILGNDGVGKTTLTSIIAYNLFLRNYQVGILDLTDNGKGYFFRFGACDFFALGDGCINIPQKLLVTLQDVSEIMHSSPQLCINSLPLMPGLKICLSAPAPRDKKLFLAKSFLKSFQDDLDIVFVELQPPFQSLRSEDTGQQDRVLVFCTDWQEEWPSKDRQLIKEYSSTPRKVRVVLNKQKEDLVAATRFVEKNNFGVDYILPHAEELFINSTVMEMCKYMSTSHFLKQLIPLIHGILLV